MGMAQMDMRPVESKGIRFEAAVAPWARRDTLAPPFLPRAVRDLTYEYSDEDG